MWVTPGCGFPRWARSRMAVPEQRRPASGVVRSLVRDVSGLWGAEGAALAAFLVQGLFVARWLGPRGLGIATLIVGYPTFVLTFFDTRATDTTIRFLGEFHARDEHHQAIAVCHFGYLADAAAAGATLVVVALTAWWAQSHVVHAGHTAALLLVCAVALVARSPANTSKSVLATFGRYRELATAQTVNAIVRSGLILLLVGRGWGVNGVVVGSAAALPADAALTYVLATRLRRQCWGRAGLRGSWQALRGRRREIAAFCAWSDLGSIFGLLAKQTDVLILGVAWGPAVVGYYSLAQSVAGFAGNVVAPLQTVAYPKLSQRRGAGDWEGLWAEVRAYARHVAIPLGLLSLVTLPLVPFGIGLVVGPSYLAATEATRILIAGGAIWLCLFWVRPLLLTLGATRWLALSSGAGGVLQVVGMLTVAPRFGAAGVAWVQVVVALAVNGAHLRYLARCRAKPAVALA